MFETLQSIDSSAFVFVNHTLANPLIDFGMPIITNDMLLRIGFGLVVAFMLIKGDNRLRRAALFSIVVLLVGDYISSSIIKPFAGRLRPCQNPAMLANLHLLVNCGSGKSFPSSHAVTAFTVAFFYYRATPNAVRALRIVMTIATLIALSRVFVGVHYPLDILVGSLLGMTVGWLSGMLYLWSERDYCVYRD
jgi:membrane-associated phospholipid phosphatase